MSAASQGLPVFVGLPTPGPLPNYLSLPTSEWRGAANYLAWLAGNLQSYQDGIACANQFDLAFGLLTAIGPQLDVLGNIIGASRTLPFQPSGGLAPILSDDNYRILLHATALRNHWQGTTVDLFARWYQLFPVSALRLQDNQNMSVNVAVGLTASSIVYDMITHDLILPRPQGVLYNITIQEGGYNVGEWNTFQFGSPNP